jgi:hypothetical protein
MQTDPEFPWCVEIPIPPTGLGPMLPVILDAAKACPDGAIVRAFAVPPAAEVQQWYNRIATKTPADALRLARTFRSIGCRARHRARQWLATRARGRTSTARPPIPYAVDIPIVGDGLGQNLNRICDLVRACPGGADEWGFRSRLPDGTPEYWARNWDKARGRCRCLRGAIRLSQRASGAVTVGHGRPQPGLYPDEKHRMAGG